MLSKELVLIGLLILVVAVSGCPVNYSPANSTQPSKTYDDGVVKFKYPADWVLNTSKSRDVLTISTGSITTGAAASANNQSSRKYEFVVFKPELTSKSVDDLLSDMEAFYSDEGFTYYRRSDKVDGVKAYVHTIENAQFKGKRVFYVKNGTAYQFSLVVFPPSSYTDSFDQDFELVKKSFQSY